VIATQLALKYNQRKLLDEQANHVRKLVLLQAEERKVEQLAKARDRFLRVVDKLEKLYEKVLEMRVDYVSDDDDRELTYYEQMEADYDEVMIQCEYTMHILITDVEANAKQPRKLKRGYDLYEWIEQELPSFRDEYKQGGAFVDIDEIKRQLIDTVHGHIYAVIHPGDSYEQGCIDFLVYRRWAEADEQEWLDEQAETWLAEHAQDPAGNALRAGEKPLEMDVDDLNQSSAWVRANPEEMAMKYWQEIDEESTAAEFWEDLHPNIPEDQEIEPGSGVFGSNTECSDLVLKVRENSDFYDEGEMLQAEAWARAHPDEIEGAQQRLADAANEAFNKEKAEMAENGYTWDDKTGKYWGVNDETGEVYEYKTPEQLEAEAGAWMKYRDEDKKNYWYNTITGETKYE
jgi:hypothetical protein